MEVICTAYRYEVTPTLLLRHDRGPTFSMLLSNDDLTKVVLCIAEKGGIGEVVEDDTEQPQMVECAGEKPVCIDEISCRLRREMDQTGTQHSIPANELKLILDIVDAARLLIQQWDPTQGTGAGVRVAEERLIDKVLAEKP